MRLKIPHGADITCRCWVWISEQTATFDLHIIGRLVLCNRGGECLLRGTQWVLKDGQVPSLKS